MELHNLTENKIQKIHRALNDVFGINFNFNADVKKLSAIKETTKKKIKNLKESGTDVSNKDFQKLLLIAEGIDMTLKKKTLSESADLDQAEVLLAAKQMADDLQKMAEQLASMQVEDLMSITNAMKEEVGTAEAEAFNAAAESAIASALEAVKAANEGVNNAVLTAQGQAPASTDMDTMGPAADMGGDLGMDVEPEADDFAGADAASADMDVDGREMKEDAYLRAIRMIKEAQTKDGMVSKDILKQAFAQIKK